MLLRSLTVFGLFFFLGSPAVVSACETPVYRYALERWQPEVYDVTVFHQGPLAPDQQAVLKTLRDKSVMEGNGLANFSVQLVDLSGTVSDEAQKLWTDQKQTALPWVVVRYTGQDPEAPVAWSGPLNPANVALLVDSPARQQIAKAITEGGTAAWVLLESGDQTQDEAALKLLQEQLQGLEKSLVLPEVAQQAGLKIRFPVVRLSRQTPAEKTFVFMLDQMTKKEKDQKLAPVVFPVFGRGRALVALTGADLVKDALVSCAEFMTGQCSCEVKSLNPGVDLLLAADWDQALSGGLMSDTPPPPLAGLGDFATAASAPASAPATRPATQPAPASAAPHGGQLASRLGLIAIAGVVVIAVLSILVSLRTRKSGGA